ncbi:ATP-dependent RNA helicase ROK1, putative [Plasmodium vivax]|uniref:RNA helicase n=1 Tax=Plasmodium vivax TaxID=5855 RepID=A0A564ZS77_PLAVI|nr:ATP-dependent RNA helicase ROK1, putative [Plasmodium vivax]
MEVAKQLTYGLNLTRCLRNEDLMSLKRENLKPLKNIINIARVKGERRQTEEGQPGEKRQPGERTAESVSFPHFCEDPNLVGSYMKSNKINVEFVNSSGSVVPIRFFEDLSREPRGEGVRGRGVPAASLGEGTTLPRSDYQKIINTIKGTFGFTSPTNIQKICIPTILRGWNTICISQTGSGKTCAFLVPLLVRLICAAGGERHEGEKQQEGEKPQEGERQEGEKPQEGERQEGERQEEGEKPKKESVATPSPEEKKRRTPVRSLIVVPTNELASQIHEHASVLFESFPQFAVLHLTREDQVGKEEPIDVCICTPLVLIHLIEIKKVTLRRCMLVVFDEVDKLFEVNFLKHIKRLLLAIQRMKMQKVFTTATLPGSTRSFISTLCPTYALVYFGRSINCVNKNVKQELIYLNSEEEKSLVLRNLVVGGGLHIPVLVFVNGVEKAKKVHSTLRDSVGGGEKAAHVALLTSERSKEERRQVFKNLQEGHVWYLVCTDVLSRGIDVHGIETVINYDVCYDKYSYIHRVGRACRSDAEGGKAITFFMQQDVRHMRDIVRFVKSSGTEVPAYLEDFPFGAARGRPSGVKGKRSGVKGRQSSSKGKRSGVKGKKAHLKRPQTGVKAKKLPFKAPKSSTKKA